MPSRRLDAGSGLATERWFDVAENDNLFHVAERANALTLYVASPIVIALGIVFLLEAHPGQGLGYIVGPALVALGIWTGIKAYSLDHHRLTRVGLSPVGISFDVAQRGLHTRLWSDPRLKLTLIDYGEVGHVAHRNIPCYVEEDSVPVGWGGISREAYQAIRLQLEESGRKPINEGTNPDRTRWVRYGNGPTRSK